MRTALFDLDVQRKKEAENKKRFARIYDSEYWVCVVFMDRDQREEFNKKIGIDPTTKYIDGQKFARKMGIAITEIPTPVMQEKMPQRLIDAVGIIERQIPGVTDRGPQGQGQARAPQGQGPQGQARAPQGQGPQGQGQARAPQDPPGPGQGPQGQARAPRGKRRG